MARSFRCLAALTLSCVIAALLAAPSFASRTRTITLSLPTATTTGATITVHGYLSHSPVGSLILIRRKTSSSWVQVVAARTRTTSGYYTHSFRVPTSRGTFYYDVYALRTSTAAAATSPSRTIVVRTQVRVSLASSTTSPGAGNAVVLSGTVAPWVTGTPVTIQRLLASSSAWSSVATVTPNSHGGFSGSVLPPAGSTTRYRAVVPLHGYYSGATSLAVSITPQTPAPPPDTTPPPPVAGLTLVANAANQAPSITLTWTDPPSTDYTGVIIRRTLGTTPPQSPTDGTAVADVAAPGASFIDSGVQGATTYSYALFAHDAAGNDASAVTATGTTPVPDTTPPGLATGVTATPVENGITLNWTDPGDSDFAKVVIQRSVQTPGTPVSTGSWQSATVATIDGRTTTNFTDTSAVVGVSYTYAVFAYDQAGNYRTDAQQVSAIAGCVGDSVRHVSGTLASGLDIQWSPQCAGTYVIDAPGVTVPYTTTLTVAPGTVVKASAGTSVSVIGTMNAVGTSAARITFTSTRDSSIGAPIASGTPAAGDWEGISVGQTWDPYTHTGPLSVLDLEYANVDYGTSPISGQNANTTVEHSSIAHGINEGIALLTGWEQPVVEDDTITDTATNPGQGAVYLTGGIDPNTIGGLSGTGNGVNATVLNGASEVRQPNPIPPVLTSSATWPVIVGRDAPCQAPTPGYPPPASAFCGATFGPGATDYPTLTIAPGSVIKVAASGSLDGSIDAQGTAQAPITITSINDNSIGGATGTGSPQPDDWEGVFTGGGPSGTVFDHTAIKYSGYGIQDYSGDITVTNSTFSSTWASAITVTAGLATIENNVINDSALTPDDNPALPGSAAISIQGSIDFSRIYGNTGTGDGHPGTYVSGSASGTVQAEPGWPLVIGTDLKCVRTNTTPCSGNQSLDVAGQLTIQPGALVEFMYGSVLSVEGQLTAQGTSTAPIVFTSVNDSSAGTPPTSIGPAAGDWSGISVGGTASINYTTIKYASHGVDFSGTAAQESVQNTWFDNNITALYSSSFAAVPSSTCSPPTPFVATGNTYSDSRSTKPLVTSSDYATIQNALANGATTSPNGWAGNLATGSTDLLQWSTFTCSTAAHPTLATAWQTK